jgi:hypothetical protein
MNKGKLLLSRYGAALVLAALLPFCGLNAHAAETKSADSEITALLDKLEHSNCQFQRNGSWYTGAEARQHLEMKYKYLRDKGVVTNTEAFIDQAASASSMSGQAYQVRCSGAREVQSASWLREQLQAYRSSLHKTSP